MRQARAGQTTPTKASFLNHKGEQSGRVRMEMHHPASPLGPSAFWCGEKRLKVPSPPQQSTQSAPSPPSPTESARRHSSAVPHKKTSTLHAYEYAMESGSPQNLSLVNFFSSAALSHLPPTVTRGIPLSAPSSSAKTSPQGPRHQTCLTSTSASTTKTTRSMYCSPSQPPPHFIPLPYPSCHKSLTDNPLPAASIFPQTLAHAPYPSTRSPPRYSVMMPHEKKNMRLRNGGNTANPERKWMTRPRHSPDSWQCNRGARSRVGLMTE